MSAQFPKPLSSWHCRYLLHQVSLFLWGKRFHYTIESSCGRVRSSLAYVAARYGSTAVSYVSSIRRPMCSASCPICQQQTTVGTTSTMTVRIWQARLVIPSEITCAPNSSQPTVLVKVYIRGLDGRGLVSRQSIMIPLVVTRVLALPSGMVTKALTTSSDVVSD